MSKNQSSHPQPGANRAAKAALFPPLAHQFRPSRNVYTHNCSQAHPDASLLPAGWSAAFTPLHHPKAAELRLVYGKSVFEAA
jgi:hypothetical protein